MSKTLQLDEFTRHIRQRWNQRNLLTYVFISRLKDDAKFRKEWIKRRAQKDGANNQKVDKQLLYDFVKEIDLIPTVNIYGKPVIRILPKCFQGRSCHSILDVDLKHLTTSLSLTVDDVGKSIIHGYGVVNVLGSLFGNEYKKMVTQYVIKRLNKELKNGKYEK